MDLANGIHYPCGIGLGAGGAVSYQLALDMHVVLVFNLREDRQDAVLQARELFRADRPQVQEHLGELSDGVDRGSAGDNAGIERGARMFGHFECRNPGNRRPQSMDGTRCTKICPTMSPLSLHRDLIAMAADALITDTP